MNPRERTLKPYAGKWQRYWLQALFIFCTVLLSLSAVTWVLQTVLVGEALELEAQSFISAHEQDSTFPLPRTRNLIGYLASSTAASDVPPELASLPPGLHQSIRLNGLEKAVPVYVTDFSAGRLYLVFKGYNVDRLVGIFGLIPISLLLILVYGASWVAYRFSERAISPVLRIARRLRDGPDSSDTLDIPMQGLEGEARELAMAVDEYTRRMDEMVKREQQFSADVSHELRTPITIIDGAAQFLQAETGLSAKGGQRAEMIRRACKDVSELIDAFLILAREPKLLGKGEAVDVAAVAEAALVKLSPLLDQQQIELTLERQADLRVPVNRKIFEIIISNLCRNAIRHSQSGQVRVVITARGLRVEDNGTGIDEALIPHIFERHVRGRGSQQAGEGLGLNIVKRLCDLYGWETRLANRPEGGVVVELILPPLSAAQPN